MCEPPVTSYFLVDVAEYFLFIFQLWPVGEASNHPFPEQTMPVCLASTTESAANKTTEEAVPLVELTPSEDVGNLSFTSWSWAGFHSESDHWRDPHTRRRWNASFKAEHAQFQEGTTQPSPQRRREDERDRRRERGASRDEMFSIRGPYWTPEDD